jgi:hypothetical protein
METRTRRRTTQPGEQERFTLLMLNADMMAGIADALWLEAWDRTAIFDEGVLPLGPDSFSTATQLLDITALACTCSSIDASLRGFIHTQKSLAQHAWKRISGWSNPDPELGFAAHLSGFANSQLIKGARHPDTIALLDQLTRACLATNRLRMHVDLTNLFMLAGNLDYIDYTQESFANVSCEWQPTSSQDRQDDKRSRLLFELAYNDSWALAFVHKARVAAELHDESRQRTHEAHARSHEERRDELLVQLLGGNRYSSRHSMQHFRQAADFADHALCSGRVGVAGLLACELARRGQQWLGPDHPLVLHVMQTHLYALLAQLRRTDARPIAIELEQRWRHRLKSLYSEPGVVVRSTLGAELEGDVDNELDIDAVSQLETARALFVTSCTMLTLLQADDEEESVEDTDVQARAVIEARVVYWMFTAGELTEDDGQEDVPTVLDDRIMSIAARSSMAQVSGLRWAYPRPPRPPPPPPL